MLAVETSRRSGKLERALDWVILWLKALGDKITEHMSEPVSLWAKTKADAARNSDEDVRLRYGAILLFFLFFFKLWNGLKNRFVGRSFSKCWLVNLVPGHCGMVLARTSLMNK